MTFPALEEGGGGGGVKGPVGGGVLRAREDEEKPACERTGRASSVGANDRPGLTRPEARPAKAEARAKISVPRTRWRDATKTH